MITIADDTVTVTDEQGNTESFGIGTPEAFRVLSNVWLRSGWDTKYVYSFSWLGRPVIQLPEDMIRIQELIYTVKPDVVIETGVAHGGSLIYYASILNAIGRGRVIGIDIDIRPHNRAAIESHQLASFITLLEGSSTEMNIVKQVYQQVSKDERVLVILDSNHQRDHVLAELRAYGPLVTPESYIVACDGIMQEVVGAPRTAPDWKHNNPQQAVRAFLAENDEFELVEPERVFNEGLIRERVTYWPNCFLRKISKPNL